MRTQGPEHSRGVPMAAEEIAGHGRWVSFVR